MGGNLVIRYYDTDNVHHAKVMANTDYGYRNARKASYTPIEGFTQGYRCIITYNHVAPQEIKYIMAINEEHAESMIKLEKENIKHIQTNPYGKLDSK